MIVARLKFKISNGNQFRSSSKRGRSCEGTKAPHHQFQFKGEVVKSTLLYYHNVYK